ncbi:hypothetical protein OBBRIDRAFT_778851 [Obba rivulosa]|uniref:F-box domain-containing protein n=1 Tax=Obba rivulosa TaxID=1052685 RepID=A0A8E2AYW0_9APHY|nr:hypothetical protein OBBRIDRAFT_778851 [Obba rivulosa]
MLSILPEEILLQIFRELRIGDILAIRQTCKTLEAFTRERSVWYDALQVHVQEKGITVPGLHDRDIHFMSAAQLERLTLHAIRFYVNWTSALPTWTRKIDIHPDSSFNMRKAMNVSVQFLPGRHGRFLLTNTIHNHLDRNAAAPQPHRTFLVQCWDLRQDIAACVAIMQLVAIWVKITVNTDPLSEATFAITQSETIGGYTTSLHMIDFEMNDPSAAFRLLKEVPSFKQALALQGDTFIATNEDLTIRLIDTKADRVTYALRPLVMNNDPQVHPEEYRCLQVLLLDGHMLAFCRQYIFLYILPTMSPPEYIGPITLHSPQELFPTAHYKWNWSIDSIVVSPRLHRRTYTSIDNTHADDSTHLPVIDILLRFDTWFPWPVNMLHQSVLFPNPDYHPDLTLSLPSDGSAVPYFASKESTPRMVHSVASPLRLFTPSDILLGRRGTALWLEALPDPSVPEQAADFGQRVAGKVLVQPRHLPHVREVGGNRALPGYVSEALSGSQSAAEWEEVAARNVTVFRETASDDETWIRMALEEDEGKIAIADAEGTILLTEYAPPVDFFD